MSTQRPWRRVFAEGVVIVASILLAFGLEAWWGARNQREAERTELVRIRDELIADRSRMDAIGAGHGRRAEASLRVIELIGDPDGLPSVIDVPDSLLVLIVQAGTFEPRTPVLDGLRRAGRVEMIRAPKVREALAVLDRSLVNVSESELDGRRLVYDQLVPELTERGDVGHVLRNTVRAARASSLSELGLGGTTQLAVDLSFKGLLSQRYLMMDQASFGMAEALAAVDQLVAAIEGAIEP